MAPTPEESYVRSNTPKARRITFHPSGVRTKLMALLQTFHPSGVSLTG